MPYGNKSILIGTGDTGGVTGPAQVGGVIAFTNCPAGGFAIGAKVTADATGMTGSYRVHLYKADPTAQLDGDGELFNRTYAADADYLGYFDMDDGVDSGAVSSGETFSSLRHPILAGTNGTLWAVVEALLGAEVPEVDFTLTLFVEAD